MIAKRVNLSNTLIGNNGRQNACCKHQKRDTQHTCDSYGKKAMLISFNVLIFFAAQDLHNSLNSSSGQTEQTEKNNSTYYINIQFRRFIILF